MNKIQYFAFAFLFLISFSCDSNGIFEQNLQIRNNIWNLSDSLQFQTAMQDTINPYNILFNVRTSYKYPYSNLFVFIKTIAPNGNFLIDTLEIIISDPTGKTIGKGLGDIAFLQVYYKKNVQFPHSGIYTFQIQHAMREENLKGILDIGLRIEKTKL